MGTDFIKRSLQDSNSDESLALKLVANLTQEPYQEQIDRILNFSNLKGWNRKRLYDMCMYVQFNLELEEEQHNYIGEFLTTLIGHCDRDNIPKLQNEPEGKEQFLDYVYSDWWKS